MNTEATAEGEWRGFEALKGYEPHFEPPERLPSEIVREAAADAWPVIEALASKPCPYIVKAFDTQGGTDYNSDYSWHALDKEKRWKLPGSGMLGLVNPNSDVYFAFGFGPDGGEVTYTLDFRPVVHLVDLIVYEVDLGDGLECEVAFRCATSDTVVASAQIRNLGSRDRRVTVGNLFGKQPLENPPSQRYVLPGQRHGSGVTTTAGGIAWMGTVGEGRAAEVCLYEWVKGESKGRRLLATVVEVVGEHCEPAFADRHVPPTGTIAGDRAVALPAGGVATFAQALNMRRFALEEVANPELMPDLYRRETEQEAAQAGYRACVQALAQDLVEAIRRSVEPYRAFPRAMLREAVCPEAGSDAGQRGRAMLREAVRPEAGWEADFLACLELPRASTFSPYGWMKRPFYNFCRVHAHEPFGWWTYGMHGHESLSTLFNNIVDPGLSADFLRGHIRQQREDGMYPYGVSHTTDPHHKPGNATAPLIVWEAWEAYLWSGDREFLKEAYESGKRNHDWWLASRDPRGEGLCRWLNTSLESVRDDDHLATWQATGGSQHQEALDLNCYLLVQERTLAEMARELGLPDEAERYDGMADRRARAMNERMWHEPDRVYYGIGEAAGSWANVKDISTFFPLWAKLAPQGRFERIVELATDPDTFGLAYGPPVLAANEPRFGPEAHWCGANWVEMSMFVIAGLKSYGHFRLAAELAYQNTKMVFDELERYGHFREYFNSITGEGVSLTDYIWTAMPAHFIVNVFFGIEPTPDGLAILPALPDGWNEIAINGLQVRGKRVSVSVRIDAHAGQTVARINGRSAEVLHNRGVLIPWEDLSDGLSVEIVQPRSIPETLAVQGGG